MEPSLLAVENEASCISPKMGNMVDDAKVTTLPPQYKQDQE
jgi:hypothetical protein